MPQISNIQLRTGHLVSLTTTPGDRGPLCERIGLGKDRSKLERAAGQSTSSLQDRAQGAAVCCVCCSTISTNQSVPTPFMTVFKHLQCIAASSARAIAFCRTLYKKDQAPHRTITKGFITVKVQGHSSFLCRAQEVVVNGACRITKESPKLLLFAVPNKLQSNLPAAVYKQPKGSSHL